MCVGVAWDFGIANSAFDPTKDRSLMIANSEFNGCSFRFASSVSNRVGILTFICKMIIYKDLEFNSTSMEVKFFFNGQYQYSKDVTPLLHKGDQLWIAFSFFHPGIVKLTSLTDWPYP
jgi:hypothetical protein